MLAKPLLTCRVQCTRPAGPGVREIHAGVLRCTYVQHGPALGSNTRPARFQI